VSDVIIERAVEFVRREDQVIAGDWYRPTTPGPHPVMVALHGGAWQLGGPERYIHWGPWLAARGIALFSATYRLWKPGMKAAWPECFHDARAAVQYVRSNAARLGVDPNRGDGGTGRRSARVRAAG
jgi:acetyl esterase/lipase